MTQTLPLVSMFIGGHLDGQRYDNKRPIEDWEQYQRLQTMVPTDQKVMCPIRKKVVPRCKSEFYVFIDGHFHYVESGTINNVNDGRVWLCCNTGNVYFRSGSTLFKRDGGKWVESRGFNGTEIMSRWEVVRGQ